MTEAASSLRARARAQQRPVPPAAPHARVRVAEPTVEAAEAEESAAPEEEAQPAPAAEPAPAAPSPRVSEAAPAAPVDEVAPPSTPTPAAAPAVVAPTPTPTTASKEAKPVPVRQYLDATVVPTLRQARRGRGWRSLGAAPLPVNAKTTP